jgi:lysylphosphatidylglycerol synthetase-like protein (DUF2156 family)
MDESLKTTIEAILKERSWSWAIIGIAYLIVGLTVRSWFLRPLTRRAKQLDRKVYRHLKGAYLQRSLWGWVFFMLSFVIVIMLWNVAARSPSSAGSACELYFIHHIPPRSFRYGGHRHPETGD